MNTFDYKENCENLKAKLKQQFHELNEDELGCSNGKTRNEMLHNLQQKLGKTGHEIDKIISLL